MKPYECHEKVARLFERVEHVRGDLPGCDKTDPMIIAFITLAFIGDRLRSVDTAQREPSNTCPQRNSTTEFPENRST